MLIKYGNDQIIKNNMKQFACIKSSGRRFKESVFQNTESRMISSQTRYFEMDRNKIMYSDSFKNLQNKNTILNHLGGLDQCRNVFAKTVSMSYFTRTLGYLLGINQDLAEVMPLVYYLGSPVFAYAGRTFAYEVSKEEFIQTFFSFKIVTQIEKFSSEYNGINLSHEILESLLKCVALPNDSKIPHDIKEYQLHIGMDLYGPALLECQLFSVINDFMFVINDLEDALSAKLISIWDFSELDFLVEYAKKLLRSFPNISDKSLIFEIGRMMVQDFFQDLLLCTEKKMFQLGIQTLNDVKNSKEQIVNVSAVQLGRIEQLKQFLIEKVYMTPKVVFFMKKFTGVLHKLYALYQNDTQFLPSQWKEMIEIDPHQQDKIILDYMLFMSDYMVIRQCKKFFNIGLDEMDFF